MSAEEIDDVTNKDSLGAAYTIIGILSAAVVGFLVWFIYFRAEPESAVGNWSMLATVNAFLNSVSVAFLLLGLRAIKRGQQNIHKRYMVSAALSSILFLLSYLLYHYFVGDTKFEGQGILRPIYFFILITHIILSVINVPLVFATLFLAFTNRFARHRKLARITFPIWLYVSVSGVLVYFFLKFTS